MTSRERKPKSIRNIGFADQTIAACSRTRGGHDYIRRSDRTLWAHVSDGVLILALSGAPLAYQVGNAFYDYNTRQPLYYQR